MEKAVYVLYEGDAWLSDSSLVPMGIFDNADSLMVSARELVSQRHSDEDEIEDILTELGHYNQATGYDVCYLIKVVELNVLEEF